MVIFTFTDQEIGGARLVDFFPGEFVWMQSATVASVQLRCPSVLVSRARGEDREYLGSPWRNGAEEKSDLPFAKVVVGNILVLRAAAVPGPVSNLRIALEQWKTRRQTANAAHGQQLGQAGCATRRTHCACRTKPANELAAGRQEQGTTAGGGGG